MINDFYKSISKNSFIAISINKIIFDNNNAPIDYEFIDVNSAYEKITGLESKNIVGKKITEVFPSIKDNNINWIQTYGSIAINGGSKEYLYFFDNLFEYFNFKVYSPEKNYFILMFSDINTLERKNSDKCEEVFFNISDMNFNEIQQTINKFYKLTNIPIAIGNYDGKLIAKSEFQEICEKFHRAYDTSRKNCLISDKKLFQNLTKGELFKYKCLNNMWDISTPITVDGKIMGAIYLGQFFYDDEVIDYDIFKKQAEEYGFDECAYIEALEKVPRISHEYANKVIGFFEEFAQVIVSLAYKNANIISSFNKQKELLSLMEIMESRLGSIINHITDVVMIYSHDTIVKYVNESIYNLLGKTCEDIIGKKAEEIWEDVDGKKHLSTLEKAIKTKKNYSIDILCECPKGEYKYLLFSYSPIFKTQNEFEILCTIHDYTKLKLVTDEKKLDEKLIRDMGKVAKIGGWEFNTKTGKGTWTDEVAKIHGIDPSIETNMEFGISFYSGENKKLIKNAIKKTIEKAIPFDLELEMTTEGGIKKWIRTIGNPEINDGKVTRIYGAFQDITLIKKNKELIEESEKRYRNLFEKAPIGIAVHSEGKVLFANPAALNMFGTNDPEQLIGKQIIDIIHPSGHKKTLDRIKKVQAGEKGLYPAEDVYVRLDGTALPVEVLATNIKYEGKPAVQVIITDITERKKAESNLKYLSYHDQLTGVYNRRFFEDEMHKMDIIECMPLTFIMADVNGLKLINDSFGHRFGDDLLVMVSNSITKFCREGDILARLGGDEFAILLPKTSSVEAERFISSIQEDLKDKKIQSVDISVSFGYKTKTNMDEKIQDILANSENDMYIHKVYESRSLRNKAVDLIMNTLYEKSERELLHSKRVSEYCERIAEELNLGRDSIRQIKTAGLLHDIGKIGIEESILNKKGQLTDIEWEEMKTHPEKGWRILVTSDEFSELSRFVLEHQERWDGKGYPMGLSGNRISLGARIISIADAYDAMTSKRTYKEAINKNEAIEELKVNSGKQFDKDIIKVFIEKVLSRN